jgi:hypothetical protein
MVRIFAVASGRQVSSAPRGVEFQIALDRGEVGAGLVRLVQR